MDLVEERLRSLGLQLPQAVGTRFSYQPILIDGNTAYVAGQLAKLPGDVVLHPGIVGLSVDFDDACKSARACALQALAWLQVELGTLDRVRRVIRLNAFVRVGSGGFDQMSEVINAASDTFVTAFGTAGQHVRSVLGVADLPRHACVMIDLTVAIRAD
ncbi:MAG: RidA family protein [Burkholderiales bacterium]|nr:RidA family protein [Burkholderiales bacterium]